MKVDIARFIVSLSLFKRFTIASFLIMISGLLGIGWWVGEQIRIGDIRETAATTALYVDSFISPNIQAFEELKRGEPLEEEHIDVLNQLLSGTGLGRKIVSFKLWDANGRVLYSTNPLIQNHIFPIEEDLTRAWNGEVTAAISSLDAAENIEEQKRYPELLEIYSPVRLSGTGQVIAVAEFYQTTDDLNAEIANAQKRSWLVVATIMVFIYMALVGFVRSASNTIHRQETELTNQVARLTDLLDQNNELHERVQRATANTTALNERFLHRISAELHDGPVQELGLALMRLDRVIGQNEICSLANSNNSCGAQLPAIQTSVQQAMQEVRALATGLRLPELDNLKLVDVLERVVQSHERRTGSKVVLDIGKMPEQANLSVKITAYRVIQEALNNAHRHAGGVGQKVWAQSNGNRVEIEISDKGSGFDKSKPIDWEDHLGLAGMRERVESLGGAFLIESAPSQGTKVTAHLSLHSIGANAHE
jgi:signal transduction histidine kinase